MQQISAVMEKGKTMVEPKDEFERGVWLMFKRITNAYFEKEYYEFFPENEVVGKWLLTVEEIHRYCTYPN